MLGAFLGGVVTCTLNTAERTVALAGNWLRSKRSKIFIVGWALVW